MEVASGRSCDPGPSRDEDCRQEAENENERNRQKDKAVQRCGRDRPDVLNRVSATCPTNGSSRSSPSIGVRFFGQDRRRKADTSSMDWEGAHVIDIVAEALAAAAIQPAGCVSGLGHMHARGPSQGS